MNIDFKPLVRAVVDLGSESYETRARRMIFLAGAVALALILVAKMRLKWLNL